MSEFQVTGLIHVNGH